MVLPLVIAAAGGGAARGIGGILSAGKNARRERDLIKRAYKIAQRKQERDQSYTRQDTNESLNARGILNAGDGGGIPTTGAIADAYRGKGTSSDPLRNGLRPDQIGKAVTQSTEDSNQRRMALSSTKGQTGQANTLSGSVNRDLSGQFYDEQQDLWMARQQAINATKVQQSQDTVNAIGNGISTGMDLYNAGSALGAGKSSVAAAPGASPVTIRGAFNIDPVDPLGLNKQSLSGFNFNVAGQ